MNFSFAGCGFLGIYHVGVAACLKKYAPNLLVNKISGASAGALAAVCLLCDSPLGTITSSVLKTATEARSRTLGPFSPTFNVEKLLREGLLSVLPDDAHKIVSGKLFISVTRVSDGKNILLSQFDSREELIQAILCSCFIPGFSGWLPTRFCGVRYVDGGFTDNLPILDENTVTVSPFCGDSDICPRDANVNFLQVSLANTSIELSKENLYRFARILFPPPPEVLNKMCQQGFNDTLDFLQRNNLINCMRCLAVTSKFTLSNTPEEVHIGIDEELDCADCHKQRKEAIIDQLPEQVGAILQDAIDKANEGLMNWVFKHRSMKLLSVLTLPYVLPIDIAYAAFLKFSSSTPSIHNVTVLGKQIVDLVQALLSSVAQPTAHHHHHDGKFSCQLAITEFAGDHEAPRMGNRHNFDFTLDMSDVGMPQSHKEAMMLESEALKQVALRCASRCVSRAESRVASRAGSRVASRAASRAVSRAVSRMPSLDNLNDDSLYEGPGYITDDAFEQIMNVTTHQEALMAYYFLDDNNEVRVTEIFDMTDDDPTADSCGLEVDSDHRLTIPDTNLSHWTMSRNDSINSEDYEESVCGITLSDTESEHCQRCDNEPEAEQVLPPPQHRYSLHS
ncbi:1-acylglycerol-3-phosphate O-acyltransferase Pnpla3-like isoform X1 [Macrobrachium rosenbergii]|uniref:1-acylglycerol-3-phosphate O-acyltransferase Pnpla3-like isoform X1 n=1 Tax=Macrobrachium rosenbergii TaxID=79674 RepID=UPI0034D6601D